MYYLWQKTKKISVHESKVPFVPKRHNSTKYRNVQDTVFMKYRSVNLSCMCFCLRGWQNICVCFASQAFEDVWCQGNMSSLRADEWDALGNRTRQNVFYSSDCFFYFDRGWKGGGRLNAHDFDQQTCSGKVQLLSWFLETEWEWKVWTAMTMQSFLASK